MVLILLHLHDWHFKGALCSLGEGILIRRDRYSLTVWNSKLNINDNTFLYCLTLFIFGGPYHLFSFKQCCGDLVVLWEQLVYSVMEKINMSEFHSTSKYWNSEFELFEYSPKTTKCLLWSYKSLFLQLEVLVPFWLLITYKMSCLFWDNGSPLGCVTFSSPGEKSLVSLFPIEWIRKCVFGVLC